MVDVQDQSPRPLTSQEFADLKDEWDFHGGWQPHRHEMADLIATVEARDTELADTHRRLRVTESALYDFLDALVLAKKNDDVMSVVDGMLETYVECQIKAAAIAARTTEGDTDG